MNVIPSTVMPLAALKMMMITFQMIRNRMIRNRMKTFRNMMWCGMVKDCMNEEQRIIFVEKMIEEAKEEAINYNN